jgi:hypothetical protein
MTGFYNGEMTCEASPDCYGQLIDEIMNMVCVF